MSQKTAWSPWKNSLFEEEGDVQELSSYQQFRDSHPLYDGNIVPTDPHQFYELLGYLYHPLTKKPVTRLADYQYKGWKIVLESDLLTVKSNKVGYSTAPGLMALIQNCLLKDSAGYEKIICCQTSQLAKEHLYTIRKLLLESENLRWALITGPREYLLKDEVTRITELFIENPYNRTDPARVIGVGASPGSVVSWKRVNYVLASDITKSKDDYTPVLDGLSTRLANTRGRMHIETIPNGPKGRVYDIYQGIKSGEITDMKLMEITADDAVKAGVITQEFLEKQKVRLGVMYDQYFNASFTIGVGNVFLNDEIEFACSIKYDPSHINHSCPIVLGIDPGFGSSKFGFCVLMLEDDIVKVVYCKEFERPSYEDMLNLAVQLKGTYRPQKIYVDAAKPDFIKSLKVQAHEQTDYDTVIARAKHDKIDYEHRMKIIPVNFNEYGKEMLGRLQNVVSKGWFAVSPTVHKELVTQMRMARVKDNGNLDKEETSTSTYDALDACRLAMRMFKMPRA